jgi:hypothetical protein
MKSRHRPTGRGSPAIEGFAELLASLEGVPAASPRDDVALTKQAAVVLLNRPLYYTVGKPGRNATIRLSVGLSISVGPPLARRYVVTLKRGAAHASVEEGGRLPGDESARGAVVTTLPRDLEADLATLSRGVLEACEAFQSRAEVATAMGTIGRNRRAELVGVEQLYARRSGAQQRLYGFPEHGYEGSNAIEAELRRLQRVILDRYTVRLRLRILSLGIIAHD